MSLSDMSGSAFVRYKADSKYTFTLSGAQVHIDTSLAGPDGVGDGSHYTRMAGFLKSALEKQLGGPADGLSIDEIEVDSRNASAKTKTATPTEMPGKAGVIYQTSKKNASVTTNQITIRGSVHTADGKEKAFCLQLDTKNEVSSYKGVKCIATGESAGSLPMTMFDGISRELSKSLFQFDSDPTSGLLEGAGGTTVRSSSRSRNGGNFSRYDWRA